MNMNIAPDNEVKHDWSSFPSFSLTEEQQIYKIHSNERHPAWFGNTGHGRFDSPESHRQLYGTCYFGLHALASFIEVFGRIGHVSESEISRRSLSLVQSTQSFRIADLTNRAVLGEFGLTAETSTSSHYEESQKLSGRLFDAGFHGIKYRVRHDPKGELEAVALFGNPGEGDDRLTILATDPIPNYLLEEAVEFALQVVPAAYLP